MVLSIKDQRLKMTLELNISTALQASSTKCWERRSPVMIGRSWAIRGDMREFQQCLCNTSITSVLVFRHCHLLDSPVIRSCRQLKRVTYPYHNASRSNEGSAKRPCEDLFRSTWCSQRIAVYPSTISRGPSRRLVTLALSQQRARTMKRWR